MEKTNQGRIKTRQAYYIIYSIWFFFFFGGGGGGGGRGGVHPLLGEIFAYVTVF